MPRLALVVASLVAVAGCREKNSDFCPYGPNSSVSGCLDGPPGTGGPCKTSDECTNMASGNLPVCDSMENGGTCVLCTATDHALCTGTTPRCDNHTCVACVDDGDCGGTGVCLPNGSCAATDSIIHAVAAGGSMNAGCGGVGAGNACTLTKALTLVNLTKNVIKLDDPATYLASGFTVTIDVTIDARNAIIKRSDGGPILTISDDQTATILGGTIQGATGGSGDGILCGSGTTLTVYGTTIEMSDKSAINANGGCKLTVTNAMLRNNNIKGSVVAGILGSSASVTLSRSWLLSNRGGGVAINGGTFVIVGNVFSNNGTNITPMGSSIGGVFISTSSSPSNRLEFNTITNNQTETLTNNPGVHCSAGTFVARNNIIWANMTNLLGDQISGSCKHSYSDIQQTLAAANDGSNNLNADPLFNPDFSVKNDSPVRGKADPTTPLTGIAARDMAGMLRVSPADIGAYQVPVQ